MKVYATKYKGKLLYVDGLAGSKFKIRKSGESLGNYRTLVGRTRNLSWNNYR